MAFDEHLADRIRELVADERGVSEKRMFGGLTFLVDGNMAVSASGQGGLLVRVDPAQTDRLVTRAHAERFEMRGRPMNGWLRVDTRRSSHEAATRALGCAWRDLRAIAPVEALNVPACDEFRAAVPSSVQTDRRSEQWEASECTSS